MPTSLTESIPPWIPPSRPLRRLLAGLLPRLGKALAKGARATQADRYRKSFSAYTHGRLLLLFALGAPTSLRQFYAGLEEAPGELRAVGLPGAGVPVSFSQLAASHTSRPADFLAGLVALLLDEVRQHGPRRAIPLDLLTIDSTFLRLSVKLAGWLPTPKEHEISGMRLHQGYRPAQWLPEQFALTTSRVNDRKGLDQLLAEGLALRDQTLAFDLGYYSHVRFVRIRQLGGHFITRRHATATLVVDEPLPIQGHFVDLPTGRITVTGDARVTVGTASNHQSVVVSNLRLVTATVAPTAAAHRQGQKAVTYALLTDRFDLTSEEVVQAYLWRWQIELFFRWLKHELAILPLLGYSENAIRVSVWVALLRHLLILLATAALGKPRPTPQIAAKLTKAALDLALHPVNAPTDWQPALPGWEAFFDP